jgi:hypothetical protein
MADRATRDAGGRNVLPNRPLQLTGPAPACGIQRFEGPAPQLNVINVGQTRPRTSSIGIAAVASWVARRRNDVGVELHIQRKDGAPISSEQWLAYVADDPELTIDPEWGPHFAIWAGPSKYETPWLDLSHGRPRRLSSSNREEGPR